jgi:hypothetical protein
MSATIRLSLRFAKELLEFGEEFARRPGQPHPRLAELEAAIAKASRASATRAQLRKPKQAKRKAKREATRDVRAAVLKRAGGDCENCGWGGLAAQLELDHFEGKARSESVETCWLLCRVCHRLKTNNQPSTTNWLDVFAFHCRKHGYSEAEARARKRLAFVQARGTL